MLSRGRVLVIDDDPDVLTAARLLLKQFTHEVRTMRDPEGLPGVLAARPYDVIFLDMNYASDTSSGQEGFHWLSQILAIDPAAVVILMTAYGDVEMAVRAIKSGAIDFVMKPWQNEKLLASLSAGFALRQSRAESDHLRGARQQLSAALDLPYQSMVGQSPQIMEVFRTIDKVADTPANVLIIGENGTGKELVARALHRQSSRSEQVFLAVDVGAISETLFESELFGYRKGAFTDARQDRPGRFEAASGGTLFLDEIGNLSLAMQSKLLSALENRQVTRLGDNTPRDIDIRLISATSMDISVLIEQGRFRQDLYYRINTIEVVLPALRERKDDIPLLAEYFLSIFGQKYRRAGLTISREAREQLLVHDWRGNVRELKHAVERAVILSDDERLMPADFAVSHTVRGADEQPAGSDLAEIEKRAVAQALLENKGNISKAAKALGVSRAALYRRMEKHGL
ncbi:MAG: sigma-54-dependent Fis family transcriptional regulator [Candidatus Marinimicrobia bacterium]|nr:sigma-54-dependent Fis family transcriptional regulator [Candidatus Neomarinimicrobiota bacterium]